MKKLLSICTLSILFVFTAQSQTSTSAATSKAIETATNKVSSAVESVAGNTTTAIKQVYSDGTSVVKEAYSVTKQLAPKLEQALESLGKSLKVGAGNVWDILVKQQTVYSICTLFALLMTIISWLHFWKRYDKWKIDTENKHIMGCVITFAVALTGTIIVGNHFIGMITGFYNPEYGAMKTVADIAAQLK